MKYEEKYSSRESESDNFEKKLRTGSGVGGFRGRLTSFFNITAAVTIVTSGGLNSSNSKYSMTISLNYYFPSIRFHLSHSILHLGDRSLGVW